MVLSRNLQNQLYMVAPEVETKVLEILGHLGTDARKLSTFASFALGNVRPDKRRQRIFCIKEVAQSVFAAFGDSLQQQKQITTDLTRVPAERCPIQAYRIDWESILANLITNSMWALTDSANQCKRGTGGRVAEGCGKGGKMSHCETVVELAEVALGACWRLRYTPYLWWRDSTQSSQLSSRNPPEISKNRASARWKQLTLYLGFVLLRDATGPSRAPL
jgi:hypothetical protein